MSVSSEEQIQIQVMIDNLPEEELSNIYKTTDEGLRYSSAILDYRPFTNEEDHDTDLAIEVLVRIEERQNQKQSWLFRYKRRQSLILKYFSKPILEVSKKSNKFEMTRSWYLIFVIVFLAIFNLVDNPLVEVYGYTIYFIFRIVALSIFGIATYYRYKNAALDNKTFYIAGGALIASIFFGVFLWALIIVGLYYKSETKVALAKLH